MGICTLIVRPFTADPHTYMFTARDAKFRVGREEGEAPVALFSTAGVCDVFPFKALNAQHPPTAATNYNYT